MYYGMVGLGNHIEKYNSFIFALFAIYFYVLNY